MLKPHIERKKSKMHSWKNQEWKEKKYLHTCTNLALVFHLLFKRIGKGGKTEHRVVNWNIRPMTNCRNWMVHFDSVTILINTCNKISSIVRFFASLCTRLVIKGILAIYQNITYSVWPGFIRNVRRINQYFKSKVPIDTYSSYLSYLKFEFF